jgi:hypothetical protein
MPGFVFGVTRSWLCQFKYSEAEGRTRNSGTHPCGLLRFPASVVILMVNMAVASATVRATG